MLITKQELCELLKVSPATVERLKKQGLPFKKIGSKTVRYDSEEVKVWIDSKK